MEAKVARLSLSRRGELQLRVGRLGPEALGSCVSFSLWRATQSPFSSSVGLALVEEGEFGCLPVASKPVGWDPFGLCFE